MRGYRAITAADHAKGKSSRKFFVRIINGDDLNAKQTRGNSKQLEFTIPEALVEAKPMIKASTDSNLTMILVSMLIGVFLVAFIYVIYQCLKCIAGSHSTEPKDKDKSESKNKNEGGEKVSEASKK